MGAPAQPGDQPGGQHAQDASAHDATHDAAGASDEAALDTPEPPTDEPSEG